MPQLLKNFTPEDYHKDFEFITNSHIQFFQFCPYFYKEKRAGNVKDFEKDYFTYGKGVDTILSKEDFDKKFFIGSSVRGGKEELEEKLNKIENDIAARAGKGGKPLKKQLDDIEKIKVNLEKLKILESKIQITETVFVNIKETAEEIIRQPLYQAFSFAKPQIIIATEIEGVKVKCMLDKLDLENGIINDDKTTASITTYDPDGNIPQLAHYRWIVREVYGKNCDCYLSVGDKGATQTNIKRSSLFYITPARLDYQEELNKEDRNKLVEAIKNNNFPPATELYENAREQRCFKCDHYQFCPFSRQLKFISI